MHFLCRLGKHKFDVQWAYPVNYSVTGLSPMYYHQRYCKRCGFSQVEIHKNYLYAQARTGWMTYTEWLNEINKRNKDWISEYNLKEFDDSLEVFKRTWGVNPLTNERA